LNFFDAQDRARRTSRRLVFAYVVATVLIVFGVTAIVGIALFNFSNEGYGVPLGDFLDQQAPALAATAIAATLLILGATAYKTAVLSAGGGRVATDLGGTLVPTDVRDPLRQRLRNVVEEMAIASGLPVPEIYVLEQENGINAFAAGYTPGDAAITVTRGSLELLDRDELQGVIGHEFSHIMNGDMRLNIRMMGVLFGIMVLGLIGRMILRGGYHTRLVSSRRDRGTPVILIIGIGLAVLGGIGVFIARIMKAGVSRQREYLADASAVQFTRQTTGIANALKKIGGFRDGSYLRAADPEEVSHMLFSTGARLSGLFATHPPLIDRIRALDPGFSPDDYPVVDLRQRPVSADEFADSRQAGLAAPATATAASRQSIIDRVGQPETAHVAFAAGLRRAVPALLDEAAHSPEFAYLLAIAVVLDRSGRLQARQLALLEQRLGRERAHLVRKYYDELDRIGIEYRLPLLAMAFPALKSRPAAQLGYLLDLARDLIEVDGSIDLYEYCCYRVLAGSLEQAADPGRRRPRRKAAREPVRRAATDLLRVIARHGSDDPAQQKQAFTAGMGVFGDWGRRYDFRQDENYSVELLDRSLDLLLTLNGDGQKLLLQAVSATVLSDSHLSPPEAELIRAVCATLHCPLPPLLNDAAAA
jgi:Zn-dependent protease with chaperone function